MNWRQYGKDVIADEPMTATEVLARHEAMREEWAQRVKRAIEHMLMRGARIKVPGGGVVYQAPAIIDPAVVDPDSQGVGWLPDEYTGYEYALTEVYLVYGKHGRVVGVYRSLKAAQDGRGRPASMGTWVEGKVNGKQRTWSDRATGERIDEETLHA